MIDELGGMVEAFTPPARQPRIGDDVLAHVEIRGSVRSRPAKITDLGVSAGFVNLVIFFDGMNDGRHGHERIGWETNVRQIEPGAKPADRTWSYQK